MHRIKPPFPVLNRGHRLAQGLVSSWMFYEGAGRTVHDVSGNDHHGTWNGSGRGSNTTPGWVAGRDGWAMEFDGTDDYISGPLNTSTDAITVLLWARYDTLPFANPGLFVLGDTLSTRYVGIWVRNTGYLWGRIRQAGDAEVNFSQNQHLSAGEWYHIVVTADGSSSMRQYVNGVQVDSKTYDGSIRDWTNFYIGNQAGEGWDGQIDDVRIYNRALSADEIAELYHDPYGMFRHNRALISVGAKPWLYRPKTLMLGGV